MKETFKYFQESNINFIQQYELLKIIEQIRKDDEIASDIAINEAEKETFINKSYPTRQKEFCSIYYGELVSDKELEDKFEKGLNCFLTEFDFDDTLKKYLGIEEHTSENIKRDLNDNFHQYLYFYSTLNLREDVKKRLNIKNIRILQNVKHKEDYRLMVSEFDSMMFAAIVTNNGMMKEVKEHRLSLLKEAGAVPFDSKFSSFSSVINNEIKKLENRTDEEKETDNKIKENNLNKLREFLNKKKSKVNDFAKIEELK